MDSQFKRILDLVRKTGDRLVVTDSDGDNAYVVMDLSSYEEILGVGDDFAWDEDMSEECCGLFEDCSDCEDHFEDLLAEEEILSIPDELPDPEPVLEPEPSEFETVHKGATNPPESPLPPSPRLRRTGQKEGSLNETPETSEAFETLTEPTLEALPEELRKAVENDLAIIEGWKDEQNPADEASNEKNSEAQPKNDDEEAEEERFYLEPID